MSGQSVGFPRRDADGRVVDLGGLLAVVFAAALLGVVVVAVIDGVFALLGAGRFGQTSGWLAAVLPFLVLADDFRAWRRTRGRILVALVAAAFGLAVGLFAAALAARVLPPLLSGGIGAAVAVLGYAVVWYFAVRRLP